jgi:Uma2 family endonuclease
MGDAAGRGVSGLKLTYDDYVSLPDDGKRYEILDGELVVTPSPLIRHQRVSANLQFLLHAYVREHRSGTFLNAPVDVILDRSTVVVPDLVFVRRERESIITERAIEGAPDLIVEIASKSTARRDRGAKMKLYARFGARHYWIVDPHKCVLEVRELGRRGYRLVARYEGNVPAIAPPFPELRIDLAEVWA